MTAEEYLDKIVIEFDHENKSEYGIDPIIEKYLGHKPVFTNAEDNKLLKRIEYLINDKFQYGHSKGQPPSWYDIYDTWKEAKKRGGHFSYQVYLKEKENREADIEDLKYQQLDFSAQELKKKLQNYDKVEKRGKDAIINSRISIGISIALPLILFFLNWKCNGK